MSITTQPSAAPIAVDGGRGRIPVDGQILEAIARLIAVAGLAATAVIHIANATDALNSARYVFWLYVALVATTVPMITLLVHWRSPLVWLATATVALAPLIGYIVSRSIGLPGDRADVGDWRNTLGTTSLFVEATVITLSVTRAQVQLRCAQAPARVEQRSANRLPPAGLRSVPPPSHTPAE